MRLPGQGICLRCGTASVVIMSTIAALLLPPGRALLQAKVMRPLWGGIGASSLRSASSSSNSVGRSSVVQGQFRREYIKGVPSAPVPHVVLGQKDVKERVILIGDVHGCCDELKLLLEKLSYRRNDTTVIIVGDLVNKGPNSEGVVEMARTEGFLAVRGNHEEAALAWALGALELRKGSKDRWAKRLSKDNVAYLLNLPYTIRIPHFNVIIAHAGIVPGVPLEEQTPRNLVSMRNLVALPGGGYEAQEKGFEGGPWAPLWPGPEHVYFGHDAKRGLQRAAYATGLDTGCLYGKKLTACVLPERKIVSVDALKQYVEPGHKLGHAAV